MLLPQMLAAMLDYITFCKKDKEFKVTGCDFKNTNREKYEVIWDRNPKLCKVK